MAADAYRQVTYLNDTTYENTQVLMEYAVNGSLGSTTTAYSFGVQRESFVETTAGMGAGAAIGGMTYQTSGTYYYTGTGSVANVTGSATNQSYTYTADGSMTAFAMDASAENETSTLTTNPTAYGTYGIYGYNGEYTHTNLGLQYLRARYLNVATGTFTSRDTYAGKLQDILSQNRYTYAENNPVGHSDPSGHAVKSGMGAAITRAFQNTSLARGKNARAATQASISSYAEEQRRKNTIAQNNAAQLKSNQGFLQNMDIAFYTLLPSINPGPGFVTPLEVRIQQCAAYNYCRNEIQELIRGKDAGRIAYGSGLILEGIGKATGAYGLAAASATVSATGFGTVIGIGGFAASAWLVGCSAADIVQGIEEIGYGLKGDSLTETVHVVKDSAIYGGNDLAYHLSTNVAAGLGDVAGGLAAARPAVGGRDGIPPGYYQDTNGRWHRPNGQFASNAEVGLSEPVRNNNSGRGGRLGSESTREQNREIADYLESQGYTIVGGGGRGPEEYLPGPNGGNKGSNYLDITAQKDGTIVRINTVDVLGDGKTPTLREQIAADSINNKTGGTTILIPKGAGLGQLPNIIK